MTSAIVANGCPDAFGDLVDSLEQLLNAEFLEVWIVGQGFVEVGDIGRVMSAMMDLHGPRVEERLQRIWGITQWRELVRAIRSLSE